MNEELNWYTLEAVRFYNPGERYNTGAGIHLSTPDGNQAMMTYSVMADDGTYAVEVRKDGVLLAHSGPPMAEAKRSSARAWRERFAKPKEVA